MSKDSKFKDYFKLDPASPSGVVSLATGKPVGTIRANGYHMINSRSLGLVRAHRVVYVLTHGPIPEGLVIDHINRNRADNSIVNLRAVTLQENAVNVSTHRDNKTGHKGISFHKASGHFYVEVMRKGKRVRKNAKTLEEALLLKAAILEELDD